MGITLFKSFPATPAAPHMPPAMIPAVAAVLAPSLMRRSNGVRSARASSISCAGEGAASAELAIEVAMRICVIVLYEGMFEGCVVRQKFYSLVGQGERAVVETNKRKGFNVWSERKGLRSY